MSTYTKQKSSILQTLESISKVKLAAEIEVESWSDFSIIPDNILPLWEQIIKSKNR